MERRSRLPRQAGIALGISVILATLLGAASCKTTGDPSQTSDGGTSYACALFALTATQNPVEINSTVTISVSSKSTTYATTESQWTAEAGTVTVQHGMSGTQDGTISWTAPSEPGSYLVTDVFFPRYAGASGKDSSTCTASIVMIVVAPQGSDAGVPEGGSSGCSSEAGGTPTGGGPTNTALVSPLTGNGTGPTTGGPGATVLITARNLDDSPAHTNAITFGGAPASPLFYLGSPPFSVYVDVQANSMSGPLVISTCAGSTTVTPTFTVTSTPAAATLSFSPSSAAAGATVTVTGTNLDTATAGQLNVPSVASVTLMNQTPTSLQFVMPSNNLGGSSYPLVLTSPGGVNVSQAFLTAL